MSRRFAVAYVSAAAAFSALDVVWLWTMADALYRPAIGHLMLDRFALVPALLFYALYFVGVVVFVVLPSAGAASAATALARGALFGLVAYGTYDLTNQATLRDWPWCVTLFDLAWGAFATAAASAVAWRATRAFGAPAGPR